MDYLSLFHNTVRAARYSLVVFVMMFAYNVSADVVINEIAWMGTVNSVNDEWVELYNNGTSSVNVDGWTLVAADGTPNISLTGSIAAGGYALLERTDDAVVPQIQAMVVYTGALSNTGEYLKFKNSTGNIIDEIDNITGWVQGDVDTKKTMQRTSTGWITAVATPGSVNTITNEPVSNNSSSSGTGNSTTSSSTTDTNTATTTRASSGSSASNDGVTVYKDPTYVVRMILPELFFTGSPTFFSATLVVDGKWKAMSGKYVWSMGDGTSYTFIENKSFNHTYQYPGTYIIQLKYYATIFSDTPSTVHQRTIVVIPDAVYIQGVKNGTIHLKNMSTNTVDLSGWKILSISQNKSFTFPETLISKDAELYLGSNIVGFLPTVATDLILQNPSGKRITPVMPRPQNNVISSSKNSLSNLQPINPYDTIPAGIPISLLSEVTLNDLELHNGDMASTGQYLTASAGALTSTLVDIVRSGKLPTLIIICIILGLLSVFGIMEYIDYKHRDDTYYIDDIDNIIE